MLLSANLYSPRGRHMSLPTCSYMSHLINQILLILCMSSCAYVWVVYVETVGWDGLSSLDTLHFICEDRIAHWPWSLSVCPVSSRDPLVVLLGFKRLSLCPAFAWTLRIQNSLPYACTAHTSLAAASQVLSLNSSPRKLGASGIGWSFLLILPVQYSISDIQSGRQKTQC